LRRDRNRHDATFFRLHPISENNCIASGPTQKSWIRQGIAEMEASLRVCLPRAQKLRGECRNLCERGAPHLMYYASSCRRNTFGCAGALSDNFFQRRRLDDRAAPRGTNSVEWSLILLNKKKKKNTAALILANEILKLV
jgi:hypothetical protein